MEFDKAIKYDTGKPRYDLIPPYALDQLATVFERGARKYEDRNWEKGLSWGRVFAALCRHLFAFWRGEEFDEETGLRHVAQVMWGCAVLLEYGHRGIGTDDRSKLNDQRRDSESDRGASGTI